jgi:hypothetical protein
MSSCSLVAEEWPAWLGKGLDRRPGGQAGTGFEREKYPVG